MTARPPVHTARRLAGDVPAIASLTLMPYDAPATLVNISETGLLAESTARLSVTSPVRVQFHGGFSPASVVGRVVRSEVIAMGQDGLLNYAIAIEFASPISLGDEPGEAATGPPAREVRNRW